MSISMNSQSALHEVESRCTQERPPRCQSLCPLGLDARAFLGHAAEGRWSDARKQLERYLPLPGLLARVCDHPCEQGCLRGDLGGAVNLHGLEIFCTKHLGVQTRSLPMPRKQKRIAVIGAGLAGLVCAWDLAGKGYPVTVFHEGDPKAQLLSCWPVLAGAGAAALTGLTRGRRQQPLDGQRDLAVRCHIDDLHLHGVAVMQHSCNVLHILVGHLRNVDHAHAALWQRNECAKRFYAGDTAFKNIPYLNRQNSILLVD